MGLLMPEAPEHVLREVAGLERFSQEMRANGWDADRIRRLPDVGEGYWWVQHLSMEQLLASVYFRPGRWLLDIGSNTCWAANRFAGMNLNVIALDIATVELQGLFTSDYFIESGLTYFERLQASMNDMPLASESLDYVFCCEVLHHNDVAGLRRTFEEIHRVLKPGGTLCVVNETLKTLRDPVGVHTEGVAHFEGYEHAHWASRYRGEAIRAGFSTRTLEPSYHWFFAGGRKPGRASTRFLDQVRRGNAEPADLKSSAVMAMRASRAGRRAYLAWVNHVAGGAQFGMIATKPRFSARALRGSRPRRAPSG